MSRKGYRCEICGKYFSYKEIDNGNVEICFTPDTQYTEENVEFKHINCKNK